MKKVVLYFMALLIFISPVIAKAEIVTVTKENLTSALEAVKTYINTSGDSEDSESLVPQKINSYTVTDDSIEIITPERNFTLTYKIEADGKVTFSNSQTFTNNMQYDEYTKKSENLQNVFFGYLMVAYIEGASIEDATLYYLLNYLEYGLTMLSNNNTVPFVIFEPSNDPNVITTNPGSMVVNGKEVPVITKEEFPSRSLEYAKSNFSSSSSFKDDKEGYLNSFESKVEPTTTDDSVNVTSTLIVDSTKDYTQLNAIVKKIETGIENSFSNMFGGNNNGSETEVSETSDQPEVVQTSSQPEVLKEEIENPETGVSIPLIILLIGTIFVVIINIITRKSKFYRL